MDLAAVVQRMEGTVGAVLCVRDKPVLASDDTVPAEMVHPAVVTWGTECVGHC